MPLMGSSRAFGFMTRMRTTRRCEKMSALCTRIDITDNLGASNLKEAQPETSSNAASSAPRAARATISGMAMREHFRRDQHHALLGHQELLGVLGLVVADPGAARQL